MSYKCRFCGKEFETHESCRGHYGHCKVARELLYKTLTKEVLEDLMFKQGMSSNYIGNVWMLEHTGQYYGAGAIIQLVKKYGLKPRTLLEANRNPERHKLYIKTVQERYGDEYTNTSQLKTIKKKKEETFYKHYGVRNIFCDNEYIVKKFEEKYGVKHNCLREGWVQDRSSGVRSHIHIRIENILKEYGIEFISEPSNMFIGYNETLHKEYSPRPDIVIPSKQVIFEIQGDLWHANPSIYKESDIISRWDGDVTAGYIWNVDEIRKKHLESFGYKVYFIWGNDITHNIGEVRCKIKEWLGLNP